MQYAIECQKWQEVVDEKGLLLFSGCSTVETAIKTLTRKGFKVETYGGKI